MDSRCALLPRSSSVDLIPELFDCSSARPVLDSSIFVTVMVAPAFETTTALPSGEGLFFALNLDIPLSYVVNDA